MRILLTGGTGLIGRALCQHWQRQGHQLWVWSRRPDQVPHLCSGAQGIAELDALHRTPIDAVINLAGAPIADRPWTPARRDLLWRSRVALTHTLVDWIRQQTTRPGVLISGSAVGWYGDCGEAVVDEYSPSRLPDFGSQLCDAWEQEALKASPLGVRVVRLRIAPVLSNQGGMLPRLLPIYKLGLGGRLGSGQQWMPWIHIDDQVRAIDYLLHRPDAEGVFNACAPEPVRNVEFAQTLARALHRPAVIPAPAWSLRLLLGNMSVLLLGGQHLAPRRLQEAGFSWQYPRLQPAINELLTA